VERLFAAIRRLKERGVAILYVSHHLDEVFAIADEVSVLRDGRRIATLPVGDLDHDRLIELMIGHRIHRQRQAVPALDGDGTGGLTVRSLAGATLSGVDLSIRPGEIVGVAGITGSGREVLVPLITGQAPSDDGTVTVGESSIANYAPLAGLKAGMTFVAADRTAQGVLPLQSVRANLTLSDLSSFWRRGWLRESAEKAEVKDWIKRLRIKTPGTEVPIAALSGGNQQKVLFGRSLRLDPSVLVLDEPTRGIDVGAKEEIHSLIDHAAANGASVLVASTDTDELVRVAHRVVVLRDGVIVAELAGEDMSVENIERAQLQSYTGSSSASAHNEIGS
jgi:ribose transport system ATP-binding protein